MKDENISENLPDYDQLLEAIWENITLRCDDPLHSSYEYYGRRGIKHAFPDYQSFKDLMYDSYLTHCNMHGEENTVLYLIHADGHYEPSNIRWATRGHSVISRDESKK